MRRGFTLVEVLVTLALLVLVLGLLLVPVFNSLGYFRTATARADAQTAARLALDSMARELTEAMYVQLDMYDNSALALFPPLRVDPDDPNSEIVTPPRPDWSQAVRYWRGLYDPTVNYNPGARFGPANTFFVARGAVPDPFTYDDNWNRWNQAWADRMTGEQGVANWAAIPRVVQMDVDWRVSSGRVGWRDRTLQPGFPYLDVQDRLGRKEITQSQAARLYRDYVVALTPSAPDYDVSELQFNPTVVAGEWLRPVESSAAKDYSVYRARYPLWRLGAPYTGWAGFSEGNDPENADIHKALQALPWARDPFVVIYRYKPDATDPTKGEYTLRAIGAFDPRSRTMKIIDPGTQQELYDTGAYPYRAQGCEFAFGVDWIDGSLRCAFPPPLADETAMANNGPLVLDGSRDLQERSGVLGSQTVWEAALLPIWAARNAGDALSAFLDPDSIRIRVDTDGVDGPDRTLAQVASVPREYLDEYQVGLDLPENPADPADLKYGVLRLPAHLAGGIDTNSCTYYVDFRWRNNGVVPAGSTLAEEKPDLISAYYRTVAVIDISITVTRADQGATAGKRVAQSAHLTRRVKLRNLLREIRYEQ